MNKEKIRQELARAGISVKDMWFTPGGEQLELEFSITYSDAWKVLETLPWDGYDLANKNEINAKRIRITLVPNCREKFLSYIRKYLTIYGEVEPNVMGELEKAVKRTNNISALNEFNKFKKEYK